MEREYDDRVFDNWQLSKDNFLVTLKIDEGTASEKIELQNRMPLQLGHSSNTRRLLETFDFAIDSYGFMRSWFYHTDTESFYREKYNFQLILEEE